MNKFLTHSIRKQVQNKQNKSSDSPPWIRLFRFFFFSLSLLQMAQYRLKYCLKKILNSNQPTNPNFAQFPHDPTTGKANLLLSNFSSQALLKSTSFDPGVLQSKNNP